MKILFFAYLRDYTKCKEIYINHFNTVEEMLKQLCFKYGSKFENKIFKEGNLSDEIIILVNGRHIDHLAGVKTNLNEGDVISIFPVVAGG